MFQDIPAGLEELLVIYSWEDSVEPLDREVPPIKTWQSAFASFHALARLEIDSDVRVTWSMHRVRTGETVNFCPSEIFGCRVDRIWLPTCILYLKKNQPGAPVF